MKMTRGSESKVSLDENHHDPEPKVNDLESYARTYLLPDLI